MREKLEPFPCTACGKCCRKVHLSTETSYLDRGDGVCRNFDECSNLCSIYNERPLVCRVEDYYQKNLSHLFSWNDFVRINIEICKKL